MIHVRRWMLTDCAIFSGPEITRGGNSMSHVAGLRKSLSEPRVSVAALRRLRP